MLAELPVAGPCLPLAMNLERQGVDQDRPACLELQVVGAAILESHAAQERAALHFQRGERGVLKLAEAPFAGVGDKRDPLGPDHLVGELRLEGFFLNLLMLDEQPRFHQLVVEPACEQPVVMLTVDQVHLPPQVILLAVHESGRVTKRNGRERMGLHVLIFEHATTVGTAGTTISSRTKR